MRQRSDFPEFTLDDDPALAASRRNLVDLEARHRRAKTNCDRLVVEHSKQPTDKIHSAAMTLVVGRPGSATHLVDDEEVNAARVEVETLAAAVEEQRHIVSSLEGKAAERLVEKHGLRKPYGERLAAVDRAARQLHEACQQERAFVRQVESRGIPAGYLPAAPTVRLDPGDPDDGNSLFSYWLREDVQGGGYKL